LYAVVRHPMYTGGTLTILGTPLALGSLSGFVVAASSIIWIIWRLLDEEAFLSENLAGYYEYRHKVRYRLVPYLW
jgi:protein-S-isoprenylcysteine O-methyltransferase Ste14